MNPISTHQRSAWLLATLLAAVLGVGCGTSDSSRSGDFASGAGAGGSAGTSGAPEQDSGAGGAGGMGAFEGGAPAVSADADAFVNNPIDQLYAVPGRAPPDILGQDAVDAQGYIDTAAACYAGAQACSDAQCQAFASCCVASGNCCELVSTDTLDLVACAGSSLDACASGQGFDADAFGPNLPLLSDGGLVPNGTVTAEGGALLGDLLSPASERIVLVARFTPPSDCGGTCLQSAGVGITDSLDSFEGAEVGLLLSGSRGVVSLILGGQAVDELDAGDESTRWELSLSPDGVVEVSRDGASQGVYPFDAASLVEARVAVFGRNLGPLPGSAAVASLGIRTEICDAPAAWSERVPLLVTLQDQASPAFMMGREPSLESGPDASLVAFEVEGEIFLGEEQGFAQVDVPEAVAAIVPMEAFEAGGVGAPDLFTLGDTLHALYTAYDADGVGRIGAAVMSDGVMVQRPAPILSPSDDEASLESPSIVVQEGLLILLARATLQSGATELRAYYAPDLDVGWARIVGGGLEALTRSEEPSSEVQSPSLIVHNGAYQLYYARRSGTRWAVELAVSDELLIWRPLGEVLGPSGEGFDSMGARGADARSRDGEVDLVYMGQDGVSFQLGYAARPTPAGDQR